VTPERLRFDFSYGKGLSNDEVAKVEETVRALIKQDLKVYTEVLDLETASKVPGVCALFGENYPNPVRVVSVGETASKVSDKKLSVEFCGGTHMTQTSEALDFCIMKETSISKGTRRIEALTHDPAKRALADAIQFHKSINACRELKGEEFVQTIGQLQSDLVRESLPLVSKNAFEKELQELFELSKKYNRDLEKVLKEKLIKHCDEIVSKKPSVVVDKCDEFIKYDRKIIQDGLEYLEKKLPDTVCMFIAHNSKEFKIFSNVPKSKQDKIKAGEWCSESCKVSGGKGGGKDNFAQGQGSDLSKLDETVKFATDFANKKLQ